MVTLKTYKGYPLWVYLPNTAAAAIFTVLFGLGAAAIIWRMVKAKAWYCTVFVTGCLFEAMGYAARIVARDNTDQLGPYIVQSVLILVAPALFAASVYMVLGRIIVSIRCEEHSPIRVKILTAVFVTGDVVSFIVQSSGASMKVIQGKQNMAENILLTGLFIQIIIFGIFIVTSGIFHRRINMRCPNISGTFGTHWRTFLLMLYTVSGLIMIRSVFRVIEYIMGSDGYLLRHEWTLYFFDALLMFAVVAIFAWWFPGSFKERLPDFEMSGREQSRSSSTPFGTDSDTGEVCRRHDHHCNK